MDSASAREKLTRHLGTEFLVPFLNRHMIALHKAAKADGNCRVYDIISAFDYEQKAFENHFPRVLKKAKSLKGAAKDLYLDQPFEIPAPAQGKQKETKTTLWHEVEGIQIQSILNANDSVIDSLKQNLVRLEKENMVLREKNEALKKKKKSLSEKVSRAERRQQKFIEKENQWKSHEAALKRVQKVELSILRTHITSAKKKNEQTKKRRQKRVDTLKEENIELMKTLHEKELEYKKEMKSAEDAIKGHQSTIKYYEDIVAEKQSNEIKTLEDDGRTYSNETRLCVMALLTEGVGIKHVAPVMENVAKFCGKVLQKPPTESTIARIGDERLPAAHYQIAQQLTAENTCLQSDETRKKGASYETYAVRSEDQEFVLGLRDMADKSAQSCFETLQDIVQDINTSTTSQAGERIVTNIKNTMSDRAGTERKFQDHLQKYRSELLPAMKESWADLSEEERKSQASMHNFNCSLHVLVNKAEVANKIIGTFEESMRKEDKSECGKKGGGECECVKLVRCVCKCFVPGADEKNGCATEFRAFLQEKYGKEHGMKASKLLATFRGNRFNIIFHNAEAVFFLATDIMHFFQTIHPPTNGLQRAVQDGLTVEQNLAIIKALALSAKLVTSPFWRLMEEKDRTLEGANQVYGQLFFFLQEAKDDCGDVLQGSSPFPEAVRTDDVYTRLLTADERDATTCAVLQLLFTAWHSLLQQAAGDHLPGGKYSTVTQQLAEETRSVPTHNKLPERIFGMLDALIRFRPNASTVCNEAQILFSLNHTAEYFHGMPDDVKQDLLNKGRAEGRDIRKKYKERIAAIEEKHIQKVKEKKMAFARKAAEQEKRRQKLIDSMQYWGLWQYPDVVENRLKGLEKVKEKREALKCQLQFRQVILQQNADRSLFHLTTATEKKGQRRNLTVDELKKNVVTLVNASLDAAAKTTEPEINRLWSGSRMRHFFIKDGEKTPYTGRILAAVPGYPEWFNCVYDGDEEVYVYRLCEDVANKDLEFLSENEESSVDTDSEEEEEVEEEMVEEEITDKWKLSDNEEEEEEGKGSDSEEEEDKKKSAKGEGKRKRASLSPPLPPVKKLCTAKE